MVSGLLAAAAPAPALAQPRAPVSEGTKDMARNHYRAGEMKFKEGNYSLALQYYTAAENILPIPTTKYKIGLCNDKLGNAAEAVRWYRLFLDSNPPEKMADQVSEVRARLTALARPDAHIQLIVTPVDAPGVSVSVDGGPPQNVASMLSPPPGHHRLVVQGAGFAPAVVDLDLAAGETKQVRINLNAGGGAGPVGPGPDTGPSPQRSNVPAFVLMGVGGASIIVGAAFGGLALQAKSNFNAHPKGDTADADTEKRNAQIADATLFGGVGLAAIGVILLVTNLPRPVQQGLVHTVVTPYAGAGGGGLVGRVTF
jgi:hypothetical protein